MQNAIAKPFQILGRIIAKRFIPLVVKLPANYARNIVLQIVREKAERLEAPESLEFLFDLDNRFYHLQSQVAARYDGGVHPKHRLTNYHEFFVRRIKADDQVLDVGCRTGEVAYDIVAKTGAQVTGIDIDRESLEMGRRKHQHPKLQLIEGDVYTWLPSQHFDVAILSNVLEHLKDRPQLLKSLKDRSKAKRYLIRVPLFERDWRTALKRELGMEWRLDDTHETEYTWESFTEEMEAAGLKIQNREIRWGEIWAELTPK